MQTELAVREPSQVDRPMPEAPSIGGMLQHLINTGVTSDNAAAVKELLGVYVQMEDRKAAQMFNAAFIELQKEIPKVKAIKAVPNNDGTPRYSFAPFEEIDDEVRPLCLKHGFTYTFSEGEEHPGKVTKVCTLAHIGGHSRSNSYSVRIGKGPPGCSDAQADGAAHSYAKRGALCDCLNIRVDKALRDDPRAQGRMVTPEQAAELERRVKETNSDVDRFLKWAGADMSAPNRFATIPANRYGELDAMLAKRERGGR